MPSIEILKKEMVVISEIIPVERTENKETKLLLKGNLVLMNKEITGIIPTGVNKEIRLCRIKDKGARNQIAMISKETGGDKEKTAPIKEWINDNLSAGRK
jgi:hypothetical protein